MKVKYEESIRRIFIDGGAHVGESVRYFYKLYKSVHGDEYEVYSFEPNPDLWELIEKEKTILHKEAMWDKDGETDFWLSQYHSEGGTMLTKKVTGKVDYNNPIKVKTIDFSKWLQENFSKDDYIVLKLDIEGAEYTVLDKMYNDGTLAWINEFWGEFHHPHRVQSLDKGAHEKMQKQLDEVGLKFHEWHIKE